MYDDDLRKSDHRTTHEALPPLAGLKFSANLWLHQYDFRLPNKHGCDVGKKIDRKSLMWPVDERGLAEKTNRSWKHPTFPHRVLTGQEDSDLDHVENDEL